MKKIHLLSALAIGAAIASCTSDDIIDKSALENAKYDDGRIAFVQKSTNMTRATTVAQDAGHYEFGVWGYKTNAANTVDDAGKVMVDYLVAFTDGTTTGINNWYKTLAENASTYDVPDGGADPTVAGDGISSWFYEGLANTDGSNKTSSTNHTTPAGVQALKYWDKSYDFHNYFAYMPYYGATYTPTVTIAANSTAGADLTFSQISSFYTDPVTDTQVTTADARFAGTDYTTATYNTEILNANEALYAANSVDKASTGYEKDVPLTFKHINAKVKIAFWEAVPGYKVELIDLVDATANAKNSTLTLYKGTAFTPATHEQALGWPNETTPNKTQDKVVDPSNNLPLPSYYKTAQAVAQGVVDAAHVTQEADIVLSNGVEAQDNIRFNVPTPGVEIAEAGGANATVMNTTHYVLPNWDRELNSGAGDWITSDYSANYTSTKVASNTGYTLHVSYKLVPEDGTAPTYVYDARVWVDPKYCHWEDGKQYLYIFKITPKTNGTTDPNELSNEMFTDGDSTTPYIDPEDPRVPENPALVPIVFDGIVVTDYEDTPTGKTSETNEWLLTDVQAWPTMFVSPNYYRYSKSLISKDDYVEALGCDWETVYTTSTPIVAATAFDGVTKKFTLNTKEFGATATGTENYTVGTYTAPNVTLGTGYVLNAVGTVGNTSERDLQAKNGLAAPTALGTSLTLPLTTYKMYVWADDAATTAWEFEAKPKIDATDNLTITATTTKEVKVETWTAKATKTTTTLCEPNGDLDPTTVAIVYHAAGGAEITKAQFDVLVGSAPANDTAYTYSFSYKYTVAAYNPGSAPSSPAAFAGPAYGIAKEK